MNGTRTVILTEGELKRLIDVMSCNLDINIVPGMQEHAKLGNVESVLDTAEVIKKDRALIQKLLEVG